MNQDQRDKLLKAYWLIIDVLYSSEFSDISYDLSLFACGLSKILGGVDDVEKR